MGRIKTKDIKTAGNELHEIHGPAFSTDFEQNKRIINSMQLTKQKRVRNKLAGYLVRKAIIAQRASQKQKVE